MKPERASALVSGWVRVYTRELPPPVAERRVDEIRADLHDHIAFERARGTADPHISLGILSRMARGVAADVAWRHHAQPVKGDVMRPLVGLLVAAIGVAILALVLDSPALVLVSVAAMGIVTLGTFALGVQTAQQRDILVPFVAMLAGALVCAALGVTAVIVGDRGDAPGLVLVGVALITSVVVGAFAIGLRTAQRTSR